MFSLIFVIRLREFILSVIMSFGKFLVIVSSCFLSSIFNLKSHRFDFSMRLFRKFFIQIIHIMSVMEQSASSDLLASGGLGDEYTQLLAVIVQLSSRVFLISNIINWTWGHLKTACSKSSLVRIPLLKQ